LGEKKKNTERNRGWGQQRVKTETGKSGNGSVFVKKILRKGVATRMVDGAGQAGARVGSAYD